MPPATTRRASPARIAWAASMTALSPEPQTLFTVRAGMVAGSPALTAACRAGACPAPAETTLPMMTSSTSAVSIPDRSAAARTAMAPSSGAERGDRPPRKRPIGVRAPPRRMTAVRDASLMCLESFGSATRSARSRGEGAAERGESACQDTQKGRAGHGSRAGPATRGPPPGPVYSSSRTGRSESGSSRPHGTRGSCSKISSQPSARARCHRPRFDSSVTSGSRS